MLMFHSWSVLLILKILMRFLSTMDYHKKLDLID
jgi:hypothetical protein